MHLIITNYNMDRPTEEEIENLPWREGKAFDVPLTYAIMKIWYLTELNFMIVRRVEGAIIYVTKYKSFAQR